MFFSAVCAASLFFICCKFKSDDTDETTYEAPQTASSAGGITLAIVPVSGASYINVYRRLVTGSSYADPVNIGEIKPDSSSTFSSEAVQFTDPYTFSGTTYQYRVRYYDSSYKVSEWSVKVSGAVSGSSSSYIYTIVSGTKLIYSSELKTLTISGTINSPALGTFDPKIALKTDSAASLFSLKDLSSTIHLTDILPASFYDADVSVIGILGETSSESTDKSYTCYYWLAPVPVTMTDTNSNVITSFKITSASSTTDNDYSSPSVYMGITPVTAAAACLSDYSYSGTACK
jgi:hypothetical protein